jgi:hypothetical protein
MRDSGAPKSYYRAETLVELVCGSKTNDNKPIIADLRSSRHYFGLIGFDLAIPIKGRQKPWDS